MAIVGEGNFFKLNVDVDTQLNNCYYYYYAPRSINSDLLEGVLDWQKKGGDRKMSITWGSYMFEGPYQLESWSAPRKSAVYAIMHKENPLVSRYTIDYFGECENLADRGFPFNHHKAECWIRRAGSKSNVYVALHYMPGSTAYERQRVEAELVRQYAPKCNK